MATAKKKIPAKKAAPVKKAAAKQAAERPATAKIDAAGLDTICARIESGESQSEIAAAIGVSVGLLSEWLNRPEHAERSARARESSAEAWLDRGLKPLQDAMRDPEIDASAARAYEQACARRAALRNPRYIERTAHEHGGPNGSPLTVVVKKYGP